MCQNSNATKGYTVKYFPLFCHPLSSFAQWQPVSNFLYVFPEMYKFCINLYPHFTKKLRLKDFSNWLRSQRW